MIVITHAGQYNNNVSVTDVWEDRSIDSLDWVERIEFSIAFALLIDRLKVTAGHIVWSVENRRK
jgi:hypothetical protein